MKPPKDLLHSRPTLSIEEFESLSLPYLGALYRHALSLIRNKTEAEDLVQEAYLKAFRAFDSFERDTNLKAWLFKILTHTFLSHYRKQKAKQEEPFPEDDSEFSFYGQAFTEVKNQDSQVAPAGVILAPHELEEVLGDELVKALDRLNKDSREIILLCDVQEFSYEEISDILSIPIGTVRSRLARARSILQKELWAYAKDKGLWRRKNA